jgi:hypothetical protein
VPIFDPLVDPLLDTFEVFKNDRRPIFTSGDEKDRLASGHDFFWMWQIERHTLTAA